MESVMCQRNVDKVLIGVYLEPVAVVPGALRSEITDHGP